ncbi:MAG TPA: hypothetical protein VM096_06875 [Vicinamibacterales bacterium]|nr:hypothetical protein [Vicinamibacterales bacterium]
MASKNFVLVVVAIAALSAATLGAQSKTPAVPDSRRFFPDDPLWMDDDMRDIAPVAKHELSKSYDFVHNTASNGSGLRGPSVNVNTLGEVPDSSWFTNRIGIRNMTIEEVLRGPDTIDGPAPGIWEVVGHPTAGVTPKFAIRDANGIVFLIKLDPATIPELASSVELIATKIFHAIGYTVPEDFIASMDPQQLRVGKDARMKSESGGERKMTIEDVQRWLKYQPRQADGTIRVLASRWVPGKVVGSFAFTSTRSDDPNDIYPHELRRELRGLRVFSAWLNHDDARSINSIDSYVEVDGRRFIRHYLQDFGSTLGSGSTSAQQPRGGYEYLIEADKIRKGLLTFGLWQRDWMKAKYSNIPSLGNIESHVFEPATWKTEYPHPAFAAMDAEDAFWAARIVAQFSDVMIRAIVGAARLTNAEAAERLTKVIIERRDKVVKHWIAGVNPLDQFEVRQGQHGQILLFDNAAVRLGIKAPGETYQTSWSSFDNMKGVEGSAGDVEEYSEPVSWIPTSEFGPADPSGARYIVATIRTVNAAFPQWSSPVKVTLRQRNGAVDIVGIERSQASVTAAALGEEM